MARQTLIIGGTRNLGPDLVSALLSRGDHVTVLNRGVTPGALPPEVTRLVADRTDHEAFEAALGDRIFDAVVDTTLYHGRDALATVQLLNGRVGRYLCWSTGQVYLVRVRLPRPFREEDYEGALMPRPADHRPGDIEQWQYGMDKRAVEDVLLAAHEMTGFPAVTLRMPMINSRRDHYGRLAAYVHRLLDGGPIVVPDDTPQPLRHVFGDDVITATLRALERGLPTGSCLNISQDDTLPLETMLGRVAELVDRPLRLAPVARGVLEDRGLLPACSPWSGRWMSALDNELSRQALGMRYAAVRDYLPGLVDAARAVPAERVPGAARRAEELALAAS